MAFKQYFPVLVILITAAAILGFFLIVGENVDRKISDAALQFAREALKSKGQNEGADFQIGQIDILSRTDTGATVSVEVKPHGGTLLLYVVRDGGWKVKEDLSASFFEYVGRPEIEKQVLERLARRLVDRWQKEVTVKQGLKRTVLVERRDKDVVGSCELLYQVTWSDGLTDRGRYAESFHFKDGAWSSDGVGSLFDAVPPPKK